MRPVRLVGVETSRTGVLLSVNLATETALTTEPGLLPSLLDAGEDLPPEERDVVLRRIK
jgi:hypothetical protein